MTEQTAKGASIQYAFTAQESVGKTITLNPELPVDRHALKAAEQAGGGAVAPMTGAEPDASASAPETKEKRGWFW